MSGPLQRGVALAFELREFLVENQLSFGTFAFSEW